MAGKLVTPASVSTHVRPSKNTDNEEVLRKLWGLEDEDNFGAERGWLEEDQRLFDEVGRREDSGRAEKRDRMVNWEKYEYEDAVQGTNEEEGEQPKYRSVEPRPGRK